MLRAAARPSFRLLAALLHAFCVSLGPGLHLWQAGACGCGHVHAPQAAPERATCGHGGCCGHDRGGPAPDRDAAEFPAEPSPAPPHDSDECRICQQVAQARIVVADVRLTTVAFDAPFVARSLTPLRPSLLAAAVLCRGPPRSSAA